MHIRTSAQFIHVFSGRFTHDIITITLMNIRDRRAKRSLFLKGFLYDFVIQSGRNGLFLFVLDLKTCIFNLTTGVS